MAGCRLACSQNKWYSDPTDTSIGARSCVGCALSGGLGVTPLVTAVCHNLGSPVCIIGSSGCGVFSPWFVMPCYAHGLVASLVCYSFLCHGQVYSPLNTLQSDTSRLDRKGMSTK